MESGRVIQYDSPLNILTHPANEFVARLSGAHDVLRRLSLQTVGSVMLPLGDNFRNFQQVTQDTDLRDALAQLLSSQQEELTVVDGQSQPVGRLTLELLRQQTKPAEVSATTPVPAEG